MDFNRLETDRSRGFESSTTANTTSTRIYRLETKWKVSEKRRRRRWWWWRSSTFEKAGLDIEEDQWWWFTRIAEQKRRWVWERETYQTADDHNENKQDKTSHRPNQRHPERQTRNNRFIRLISVFGGRRHLKRTINSPDLLLLRDLLRWHDHSRSMIEISTDHLCEWSHTIGYRLDRSCWNNLRSMYCSKAEHEVWCNNNFAQRYWEYDSKWDNSEHS